MKGIFFSIAILQLVQTTFVLKDFSFKTDEITTLISAQFNLEHKFEF